MCTVSFIPLGKKVLICSNRDEKSTRAIAYKPAMVQTKSGSRLIFPKDPDSGGTWIALKETGDVAILLNGAFENHIPEYPYRRSRGLIFLDIFESKDPIHSFNTLLLNKIEPFTLVLFIQGVLHICRWNGWNKYIEQLDERLAHIWSSVTLYDLPTREKRAKWFAQWLERNTSPTILDLLSFHQFAGDGNHSTDLLMNRDNKLYTVSITGIVTGDNELEMHYLDLLQHKNYLSSFLTHAQ